MIKELLKKLLDNGSVEVELKDGNRAKVFEVNYKKIDAPNLEFFCKIITDAGEKFKVPLTEVAQVL